MVSRVLKNSTLALRQAQGDGLQIPLVVSLSNHNPATSLFHHPVRLFVGNLSYEVEHQELRTLLQRAGRVTDVYMPLDRVTQRRQNRGGLSVAAARHCPIGVATASWGCPPRLSEVIEASTHRTMPPLLLYSSGRYPPASQEAGAAAGVSAKSASRSPIRKRQE